MSDPLEMFVPECDESDPSYRHEVRACNRINMVTELAHCLGKTYAQVLTEARFLMRPDGHPHGRQYMSGAVAELYASYKINAPYIFDRAKRPFLSGILGQIRVLEERGSV